MVSNGQLIEFKVSNWDSHFITATSNIDNNNQVDKSACGFGAPEQQYEYYYAFDGLLPVDTALRPLIVQTKTVSYLSTKTIMSGDFPVLKSILSDVPIQVNVYYILKRQGSNRIFASIQRFYFYRNYSPVIAVLDPDVISIDQYYPFVLNGS